MEILGTCVKNEARTSAMKACQWAAGGTLAWGQLKEVKFVRVNVAGVQKAAQDRQSLVSALSNL